MRKKDPQVNENIDRTPESDNASPVEDKADKTLDDDTSSAQFTKVKNASASGLGTMGRNDEKLSDQTGNDSGDTY